MTDAQRAEVYRRLLDGLPPTPTAASAPTGRNADAARLAERAIAERDRAALESAAAEIDRLLKLR